MADDSMRRRRELAARAFILRRSELGLTQEEVARRGGIVVRTVHNFEHGRWPNAKTRAMLENAVGWPAGEIGRISSPPDEGIDWETWRRVRALPADQRRRLMRRLAALDEEEAERSRARG